MAIVATRVEAAKLCEVSEKALGNWKLQLGFPHREDGQYDVEAILQWREAVQEQRRATNAEVEELGLRRERAKTRREELRNESEELGMALRRGELLPRALVTDVLRILMTRVQEASNALQRVGDFAAVKIITEQLAEARKQIDEHLARANRDASK